jgi:SRSO17 transposase
MTPKDLREAWPLFEEFSQRFTPLLVDDQRTESRAARAKAYLRGLLLDAESTKTAEAIALNVHGDPSQVRMTQVFLGQSAWADEPLREELVRWVDQELGSPAGTLIVDESGIPKCGDKSVGVARQYCGATGKIDNCQVAVYLAYAGAGGHTLLDERLYLPEDEWAQDAVRRHGAGVPEGVVFRTKPELALELIRHVGPKIRHGWVTFDEGYGKDPEFLSGLEQMGERYIGEVPKTCRGWLRRPKVDEPPGGGRGRPRSKPRVAPGQPEPQTAEAIAAALPAGAWKRLPFREGTKGTQVAHFAAIRLVVERDDLPGPELWLVIERSCDQAPYVKYYLSNASPDCPLLELAQAGHNRWPVEDCFLRGKQEVGLDDYEVRGWRGFHHHMTLVMLALWFLVLQTRRLGEKNRGRADAAGCAATAPSHLRPRTSQAARAAGDQALEMAPAAKPHRQCVPRQGQETKVA